MYGEEFLYDEIETLELKEALPKILLKTNGAAIGDYRKGYFKLEGLGKCKLFTMSENGPFIYIKTNDQYVILNYKEEQKTQQLYQDLLMKWNEY